MANKHPSVVRAGIEQAALGALLVGAAATAFAPILVRWSELPPTATAFHRMALAIPMMWAWTALSGSPLVQRAHAGSRRDYFMLAIAGVLFALDLICLHWSIMLTSVANAILFLNFQPVFVVLGAWAIFGERFTGVFLAGLATAVAGAGILMSQSASLGPERLLGDGLGILSGVFYAAYILTVARLRSRYDSSAVMTWTCIAAAPILLGATMLMGEPAIPAYPGGWVLLAALAFIGQIVGNGLIVYALAHLPASFSAVSLLSQPVMASLFAWALLAEPLGLPQSVGIAVVLVGIGLSWKGRIPAAE